MRLEFEHVFLGEYVRDDLTLAGMGCAVSGIEETTVYGDERVVEVGLERAVAVCINSLQSCRVGDGDMVRRYSNYWPCSVKVYMSMSERGSGNRGRNAPYFLCISCTTSER